MESEQADNYHRIVQLVNGAMATEVLRVAAKLNLADKMAGHDTTAAELGGHYGIPAQQLARLLRALTALGLCAESEPGRFTLTDMGSLLRQDRPDSAYGMVRMFTDPVILGAWPQLETGLRTGQPMFENVFGKSFFDHLAGEPELSTLFNGAMGRVSRAVAEALPDVYDFGRFSTVTDVGGGDGTVLAEILRRTPGLRGVVFDATPEIVDQVAGTAAGAGVSDRCSAVAGDFFQAVPTGSDLYLLKSVVHDWDDERVGTILRNCRAAMPEHGRLVIVEPVLPDVTPADANPWPYLMDLHMLVLVGGMERTRADFDRLCTDTGFRITEVRAVTPESCLIEAVPV